MMKLWRSWRSEEHNKNNKFAQAVNHEVTYTELNQYVR
jgi:hypothetical protein